MTISSIEQTINEALYVFDTVHNKSKTFKFRTPSALNLLLLTCAVESDFGKYHKQKGGGPARSIYQIEPGTFTDIYTRVIKPKFPDFYCSFAEIETNDTKATIIARMKYYSIKEALPDANDVERLAQYWKRYYNTEKGKGTVEKAIQKYQKYVLDPKKRKQKKKQLFQQDDCAPDSLEYFLKSFQKTTEMTMGEFVKKAELKTENDSMTMQWWYSKWVLEYSGDDPFYILYEV